MTSLFQNLLSQLEEKISKKNSVHEKIAKIVSEVLHTTITADQITLQDTTIRIKTAPTAKMALMLNKEKIITALQKEGIDVTTIQ